MAGLKALAVHGDAFLYQCSKGTVLVDGGGSSTTLGKVLANELPKITRLDIVVCTHADSDHAKGLRSILTKWRSAGRGTEEIGEFWLPGRWMEVVRRGLTDPKDLMSKLVHELDEGLLDDARALIWAQPDDDAGEASEDGDDDEIPLPTLSELAKALEKTGVSIELQPQPKPTSGYEEQLDDEGQSEDYAEPFEPDWLGELRERLANKPETPADYLAFKNARRKVDYRTGRYPSVTNRGLPVGVWTNQRTANYCLALIDAAEAIVKIARHAIQYNVPIRWFDQDLYVEKRAAQGGRAGFLLPMNSVELRAVPTAVAPSVICYMLSKANRESLAFYAPADADCRGVVFCADSRMGTGRAGSTPFQVYPSMKKSDQIGTAPHHAAESAASAYAFASKFGIVGWVCAANGRTEPGPTFRTIAEVDRCCTGCKLLPKVIGTVTIDLKAVGFKLPGGCTC